MTTTTMTIEDRAARRGEIEARLTTIGTEHGDDVLPDDVQSEWDTLSAELGEHGTILDAHQQSLGARRDQLARIAARQQGERVSDDAGYAPPAGGEDGHVSVPAAPPAGRISASIGRSRTDDIYDLNAVRRDSSSPEDAARRYRDNARRAIERGTFPGSPSREQAQANVERLLARADSEDADLAKRILVTGSETYMRAWSKAIARLGTHGLATDEIRALSVGTDSAGGFAVPYELDPTINLTSNGAINPLRQISRVQQITGKEYDLVTSAGVTVSRSAEGSAMPDNSPTLAQPTIRAERVTGFIPFSMELEQDWASLQSEMLMLLADAKDVEESASFTNGAGTGTTAGGIITTLAAGSVITGGASGALSAGDLYLAEDSMAPRFRTEAVWMASKTTYNAYRQLFTTTASAAGDPWVRPSQGTAAELLGYAAYEDSDMVTTHAAGDKVIILGDFKRGFIIVDRLGMTTEIAPLLFDQATGRPNGQRGLVLFWRNNSRVIIDNAFRLIKVAP